MVVKGGSGVDGGPTAISNNGHHHPFLECSVLNLKSMYLSKLSSLYRGLWGMEFLSDITRIALVMPIYGKDMAEISYFLLID